MYSTATSGLNLGLDKSYQDLNFSWFSPILPHKYRNSYHEQVHLHPFNSLFTTYQQASITLTQTCLQAILVLFHVAIVDAHWPFHFYELLPYNCSSFQLCTGARKHHFLLSMSQAVTTYQASYSSKISSQITIHFGTTRWRLSFYFQLPWKQITQITNVVLTVGKQDWDVGSLVVNPLLLGWLHTAAI